YYESRKHSGELPIVGVNTFLNDKAGEEEQKPIDLIRSTEEEKRQQIENLEQFWKRNEKDADKALNRLKEAARNNGNLFEELMETVKAASLGQISHALYEVGGQYRRNM
ncbi:MAG TPA: methylmalonyl-CoA mutase family protein, partial [Gracilimonas sp.]|uniref:methylmalonyl-CoA mutase family protein n=1 Tax=Gracilimonas sp. TaxID=1974203 RepID=UPI002D8CECF0|nr:methylmalonyl-CoA mutase family protein [Gracilimonas sp.]